MKQEFFIHFAKVKKFTKSRIHEIVVNIQKQKSFAVCHLLGNTANGCLCRGLDRRAHGKAGIFAVGRIGAHGKVPAPYPLLPHTRHTLTPHMQPSPTSHLRSPTQLLATRRRPRSHLRSPVPPPTPPATPALAMPLAPPALATLTASPALTTLPPSPVGSPHCRVRDAVSLTGAHAAAAGEATSSALALCPSLSRADKAKQLSFFFPLSHAPLFSSLFRAAAWSGVVGERRRVQLAGGKAVTEA